MRCGRVEIEVVEWLSAQEIANGPTHQIQTMTGSTKQRRDVGDFRENGRETLGDHVSRLGRVAPQTVRRPDSIQNRRTRSIMSSARDDRPIVGSSGRTDRPANDPRHAAVDIRNASRS